VLLTIDSMDQQRTGRRLSVVVPVYNGAATLEELAARLTRVLDPLFADFEIILVDDGSRDGSRALLETLARGNPRLRPIPLMRNYGQHNALLCGIRAARYELLVTLDDDLQNPPEEIPKLLARLDEGFDVVYGTAQDRQHDAWRNWASALTRFALRSAVGAETARWVSPFRLFRTGVREAFRGYESSFVSIDVLLTWGTTRFAAVPVDHQTRRAGASNYTFRKLLSLAMNMVTGYSTLPLQVASLLGFMATLLGIVLLGYVLVRYILEGSRVPGFPFLASIIVIFAGTQLFALGIIGEYLARMHFRMMGRPPYAYRSAIEPGWRASGDADAAAPPAAVRAEAEEPAASSRWSS
jgi:glycosyltransferase involved in cell wall biosynthesis